MKWFWATILALSFFSGGRVEAKKKKANLEKTAFGTEREASTRLAERIPAVTGRLFTKKKRFELAPTLGLSVNDPFYQHGTAGLSMGFHLSESLGIRASGETYLGSEKEISIAAGGDRPQAEFDRPEFAGRVELLWAPFYGKMSILAETVTHFDIFFAVGGGMVLPKIGDPVPTATLAVGQHIRLSPSTALVLEFREQFFMLGRSPQAGDGEELQNLLSFHSGFAFYFPKKPRKSGS